MSNVSGRMDIDISLVEDSRRLAKQCKMADLIEELENKCKQVYEFGKKVLFKHMYIFITCMQFSLMYQSTTPPNTHTHTFCLMFVYLLFIL